VTSSPKMTRLIPIGDVELRLDMIARALGIPAATLDKLASGEWVAVPREPVTMGVDFGSAPSATIAMRVEWENGAMKYTTIPLAEYFAAATEAASHDD
jgi:hypothetical protein